MALSTRLCLLLSLSGLGVQGYSLGSPCNYDDDCFVEHAFCQMQTTCNCKRGYRPSEDYYQCIATVGAACHSKHDCSSLPNSVCSVDTCDCDQGFVPDTNSLQCIPVAQRYQSRCNQTDQCTALLGALGHCSPANGTCLCRAGAHYHSGRCFPNVDLGLHCQNKSYCYINERMVGRLDCINHVCQCASGFSRTGNYCSTGATTQFSWTTMGSLMLAWTLTGMAIK